jgi:uncharacterized membrane protein
MELSHRRALTLAALVAASVGCVGLVLVRIVHTGVPNFLYLTWNLLLAWVPFVLALVLYDAYRRGRGPAYLLALGAAWLAFFPNAPYIVTDFIHLNRDPLSPLWYDGFTIGAFAATGLVLGFGSLYLVHAVVRRVLGEAAGWALALGAIVLGSVGVYLGRFVRVNSWDIVWHPHLLARLARVRLADPLGNPKLVAVTIALTGLLTLGYLVVYGVASPLLRLERDNG